MSKITRTRWLQIMNRHRVIGPTWPWIAQSDKRMLPRVSDPGHRPSPKRWTTPEAVYNIRAAIRQAQIQWK